MPTFEGFLPSATPTGKPIALPVYRDNDGVRKSLDSKYPTVDQTAAVYPADEALTEAVRRWGNDPDDDEIDRADSEWDDSLEPGGSEDDD